ncbi:MAG TPA: patatin-like phospholipase family protein [Chromatiales bacterium]|nr:patatin-like phospholipase family protein [Thiotrichales bacterium]HIP68717.1 patatin-like phospholipase family protein [Chromatiales bacterium]
MKNIFRCVLLFIVVGLTGCVAHFPINPPLSEATSAAPYYLHQQRGFDRSPELLVVLAFSGGGMRASALSYGVLKTLAETPINWRGRPRKLADEIDLISSVSGGSFTAAYFGLKGYRLFDDYETKFLKHDVEGVLFTRLFNPMRWFKLSSPYYDRSEMAEEYYDEILFHGATFSDLVGRPGPAILINATDLTIGTGFGFHQEQFDWMCSSVSDFPISRAVTASSAVPGLFSAVTVFNYGGQCDDRSPQWMRSDDLKNSPELQPLARKVSSYLDSKERPYIHLMDGGLADNLGLRAVMEQVAMHGGAEQTLDDFDLKNTRKILVIVVNAAAAPNIDINKKKNPPTAFFSIDAATTVQINLYNDETINRFRENVKRWKDEISLARCGKIACKNGVDFYFVNASLADLKDKNERKLLQELPTTFSLESDEVDRLVKAADELLRNSAEFQKFLSDVSH